MGKGAPGKRAAAAAAVEVTAVSVLREALAEAERSVPELERIRNISHHQWREAEERLDANYERIKEIKTDIAARALSEIRTDVLLAPSQATRRPLSAVLLSPNLPDWPIEHLALRSPRGGRLWWSEPEVITVAGVGARWRSGHLVEPIPLRKASTGELTRLTAAQVMVETEPDGTPCLSYPAATDVIPFSLLMGLPVSDRAARQTVGSLVWGVLALYVQPGGIVLDPASTTLRTVQRAFARGDQLAVLSPRTRERGLGRGHARQIVQGRDDPLAFMQQWPSPAAPSDTSR